MAGRIARIALVVVLAAVVAGLAVAVGTRAVASGRIAQQEAVRFNAATPSASTASDEPIVTVIGDNMSAVAQAARPAKEWPLIVAPELGARIISMSTASSGYTAKPVSWTYGGTFLNRAPHIARDSAVVVIFGGANDSGVRTSRLSDTAINTVIAVRDAAPDATVLMVGPVHSSVDVPEGFAVVRNTLRSVAAAQKVQFVDPIALKWVDGRSGLFRTDGVTPTEAGQELIAQRMEPLLQKALAQ